MNINDKIYAIKETSHIFDRQKLTMTDELGNTWYRYDKPVIVFELNTHTIVGKVSMVVEGIVDFDDDMEDYYYTDLGSVVYETEIDCEIAQRWFTDEKVAQKVLEEKRYRHEYR